MDPLPVGVLGCGTISRQYCDTLAELDQIELVACADLDADQSAALAAEYDLEQRDTDELLAAGDVAAILNLTPPSVHADTTLDALEHGKHVHVEKPLAATVADGRSVVEAAAERDLLVSVAPDTVLGSGIQRCRHAIDAGAIGDPIGATAIWLSGGHESWHGNPGIFYREGGGPLFDMGPYYVTALVTLLGPVERVYGATRQSGPERTYEDDAGETQRLPVEVPTHEVGLLEFAGGATATVQVSFDAAGRTTLESFPFEVYGTDGSLRLTDPNRFTGTPVLSADDELTEIGTEYAGYTSRRGAGLVDMAYALAGDWEQRLSARRGLHVLEIMAGIRDAGATGEPISIETAIERPAAVPSSFPDRP